MGAGSTCCGGTDEGEKEGGVRTPSGFLSSGIASCSMDLEWSVSERPGKTRFP